MFLYQSPEGISRVPYSIFNPVDGICGKPKVSKDSDKEIMSYSVKIIFKFNLDYHSRLLLLKARLDRFLNQNDVIDDLSSFYKTFLN